MAYTNKSFDLKNTTRYKRIGEYKGSLIKIDFLCPNCNNTWLTSPNSILSGHGCSNCDISKPDTNDSFDKKVLNKGIKYRRIGEYISSKVKIDFLCPECNIIWSTRPYNILAGKGCPNCTLSGFNVCKQAYLYFIQIDNFLKIGITNREPKYRYKEITNKEVVEIKVIQGFGQDIRELEQKIHNKYEHYNPNSLRNGNTECFSLNIKESLLEFIHDYQL